jgi:hypothetical protein
MTPPDFVMDCREMGVTPHVVQNTRRPQLGGRRAHHRVCHQRVDLGRAAIMQLAQPGDGLAPAEGSPKLLAQGAGA